MCIRDRGEPILTAAEVPVVSKNRQSVDEEITVENQTYRMTLSLIHIFRRQTAIGLCAGFFFYKSEMLAERAFYLCVAMVFNCPMTFLTGGR